MTQAPKGHFTQERHRGLLAQVKRLLPAHREVLFLGDGEFDGGGLLQDITEAGWHYVCCTTKSALLAEADWPGETFSLCELGLTPGDCVELPDLLSTAQGVGPVLVGAVWETGQKEPLLLVTNLDFLEEARFWCRKRFGIETFFSDQKSRGFYPCHSTPIKPPSERPRSPVPPLDRDLPGLLLAGLPGGRSRAAGLAGPHPPQEAR